MMNSIANEGKLSSISGSLRTCKRELKCWLL